MIFKRTIKKYSVGVVRRIGGCVQIFIKPNIHAYIVNSYDKYISTDGQQFIRQ